jgi:starch phosphorylase
MDTGMPRPSVAYFSMEIGLDPALPTYAGGLGLLSGDTIRSAADMGVPMVAVTLVHRHGYFQQKLDAAGQQTEAPVVWDVASKLESLDPRVTVEIGDRKVVVRGWLYQVTGVTGHVVPVFLLDTDLPENDAEDRKLTDELYGGDREWRLKQEAVLGIGGVRLLRALGYDGIRCYHLNEGHASLITLALAEEFSQSEAGGRSKGADLAGLLGWLRERCVFTTHTPVPAGHDRFPADLVAKVLGGTRWSMLEAFGQKGELNMTTLALACSRFVNGVALRHSEVSRDMFPGVDIRGITNGVHAATWASPSFQRLFDRRLPDWRSDAYSLRYAISIPLAEIAAAHAEAKTALVEEVNRRTGAGFTGSAFTVVFARRATAYKRPFLIFEDLDRLKAIAKYVGPIQIVYAGKAHPHDDEGKAIIRRVFEVAAMLKGKVPVVFLENYDITLARILCAGCDVWLNNPRPPLEASGTSGMKAAVNGVPSLSVLDGWWIEGHIEGVTGWAIGELITDGANPANDKKFANALYDKIAKSVMPCFYKDPDRFTGIMRSTIAMNGSYFNTHRMLTQYLTNAYKIPRMVA